MRPETFYIRLLPATERSLDGQRLGEICIGSFVERFAVYPFAGDAEAFVTIWDDALRSLLAEAKAVGLPTASNATWIMYRVNSNVLVQQMLMLAGVGPQLLSDGRVEQIPVHRSINDDGQRISEWTTTVEAISGFVGGDIKASP